MAYNGVDGFWRVEWRSWTMPPDLWYLQAWAAAKNEAMYKLVLNKFEYENLDFRVLDPKGNVIT